MPYKHFSVSIYKLSTTFVYLVMTQRFNYYFQFTLAISAEPPHPLVSLNLSLTEGQQPTIQYLLWCRTLFITHVFMQLTISSGCTFTVHACISLHLTLNFALSEV